MPPYKNFFNKQRQHIGWYKHSDHTFRKYVKSSRHILQQMDAWGVEKYVVEDLQKLGAKTLRLKDVDECVIYSISLSDFLERAVEKNYQTTQLFVSRKYFTTETYDRHITSPRATTDAGVNCS